MAWIDNTSDFFNDLTLTSDEATRLDLLAQYAQAAIEKYLGRTILSTEHDEVLPALQDGAVCVSNFPILSVARICDEKNSALTITNSTAQVSSCYVTTTGLNLTHVTSGVRANNTLAFSSYVTISSLATAITALGNGWSGTAISTYASYPSTDLVNGQYENTTDSASLYIWEDQSSLQTVRDDVGIIEGNFGGDFVRVIYTAGFATVPYDLQKACADLARDAFDESAGGSLQAENLGDYSYSLASMSERMERLGITNKSLLGKYKDRKV